MRYRLCMILLLLVLVLAGCTSTVTVAVPDLYLRTAGSVSAPDSSLTANVTSPTEIAEISNSSKIVAITDPSEISIVSNLAETTADPIPAQTTNDPGTTGITDVNVTDRPNESVSDATMPEETADETAAPEETVPAEDTDTVQNITISAVGDILVHDNCLACVRNGDEYDFDPPFSEVMPILQSSDLAIGNLETSISGPEGGYGTIPGYNNYPKFNAPDSLLDTLKKAGLDVLITANNHCLDRGTEGLIRTIEELDARGFLYTGTYKSQEDSEKILVTNVKGIKIAILAYTYSTNGQPIKDPVVVNLLKTRKMLSDVESAKELKPDIIIAYLHMGDEYARQPNSQQKNIADSLIKAGVDIVLGNHPHVLQPMERKTVVDDAGQEREGLVIYSLGNFTTGYTIPYSNTTGILNIGIEKDMTTGKVNIEQTILIPTWTQLYKKDGHSSYRVIPMSSAIEKYEDKTDEYITEKDYEFLKGRMPELINHVNNGPAN